jgi:hypothetical protein
VFEIQILLEKQMAKLVAETYLEKISIFLRIIVRVSERFEVKMSKN